jgi:pimeloyl-ACP methyl ester carboxylesterase
MAPVAQRLSGAVGVLEPLLTATTVNGQVEECAAALREYTDGPAVLIGHSWGAWLSMLIAARYPSYVRKVVCVGSAPFEEVDAAAIMEIRLGRLDREERAEAERLMAALDDPAAKDRDAALAAFGRLMAKTDLCCPPPPSAGEGERAPLPVDGQVYRLVWAEARELRRSGRLLEICGDVRCPVVAIHGDYDPHPAGGVEGPLSRVIQDFRFILLEDCGHCPWVEERARGRFYEILAQEIA